MNLRHLEFFVAITRRGTFSGASTEVGVSQSALSQAVSALESELCAPLFDRSPTGVRLTAAGREFLPHATAAIDSLRKARDSVDRVGRLAGGHLSIACPASLGIDPLPRFVGAFRLEFPGVVVRVHNIDEHQVCEQELFDSGADVVVTFAELVGDDLHAVTLSPVELYAVLPRKVQSAVSLEDLAQFGLITTPAETAPHRFVGSRLGREELRASTAVEVVHPEAVLPLVVGGAGAAVLPQEHARMAAAAPGVSMQRLEPPAAFDVAAAIPRSSQSVAAHQFIRICRELA